MPIVSSQEDNDVPVGESLLGRVLDGRMQPIDGLGRLTAPTTGKLGPPPNPMRRQSISPPSKLVLRRSIHLYHLDMGRVGIFSGSGVGKSVLGMLARNSEADVNVIALVGERGGKVKDFIRSSLVKKECGNLSSL